MTELCQRCKEEGDDRRTLWMACFYDMDELKIPFDKEAMLDKEQKNISNIPTGRTFYTLRVCKDCRSDWMRSILYWWNTIPPKSDSCDSGIYVRDFGTNKEITLEEYTEKYDNVE